MSSKCRIALYLPSLRGGGAERVMLALANAFASRGLEVDLVLAEATGEYMSEISPDVRLVDLKSGRVMTSLPALVRYLRRERPGVLLSAMSHANVVAVWARALAGTSTRVVVTEHINLSQFLRDNTGVSTRVVAWAMGPSYWRADGVIAVSNGVAASLAREVGYPIDRIQVIYNPMDLMRIQQRASESMDHPWFTPHEPPVILGVGRLMPQKDFPTLLRAFSILRKTHVARLVILGEGELRVELKSLAHQLGIEADVFMPGFVGNPFAYMARAQLFALSSRYEGLPTVLIEAMACGCPVVSTDCPSGPAEILEDGKWGRLVPVGDMEALADAMAATLDETGRRDAMIRASEFGLDIAIDNYLHVLFPDGKGGSRWSARLSENMSVFCADRDLI
jgi:glycosyltransferase involved in cell wall biosynthesis